MISVSGFWSSYNAWQEGSFVGICHQSSVQFADGLLIIVSALVAIKFEKCVWEQGNEVDRVVNLGACFFRLLRGNLLEPSISLLITHEWVVFSPPCILFWTWKDGQSKWCSNSINKREKDDKIYIRSGGWCILSREKSEFHDIHIYIERETEKFI